ncbi:L,D-transpeptidase [Actinoallomurus rhizosphaericola]|uniref:L,D-transpeptidase n=1 Tax=Actinoallomurus rhizosphaericola TaxID=2952536 RepID=UPI002093F178|nr:L,D-transpeptidase [Actinoallomurus rhizosphaericola]MCO5997664.1 L,D-transpeptidase [Actinoallomurus rhizosphaericola]
MRHLKTYTGALLIAGLIVGSAGCGSAGNRRSGDDPPTAEGRAAAEARQSRQQGDAEIATVRGRQIAVHRQKGDAAIWKTLSSPNEMGATRVFLVDGKDGDWLKVLLPIRPNGSTGWVKASDVTLSSTTRRVEIDAKAFTFTVFDGDKVLRTGKVATGEGGTPTPAGRFYFTELVKPPNPNTGYGAYAFGLSGFSPTLKKFAGGPGQLAIHGTNQASALGGKASHGCVRVSNDDITWMATNLTIGTPVVVK